MTEDYYCGLCGRMMPISHFPHSEHMTEQQHSYNVALWASRLGASPVATQHILASTPLLAAIQAMQEYRDMACVVVMSQEQQYSFFDAEWHDGDLYFSKEETYPRLAVQ